VIVPETKDWTWVLDRTCPDCGFDTSGLEPSEVAQLVRANAADWARLHADGRIRPGRPDPMTWSSLEYACHVRDVYRRYDGRLRLMLDEDDPLFPNWDQDASAVDERYEEQSPAVVLQELAAAADEIADRFAGITPAQATRPGRRSDGAVFSVATIGRYMIHDPIHHVWDVQRFA
jgi:hypothetical protein